MYLLLRQYLLPKTIQRERRHHLQRCTCSDAHVSLHHVQNLPRLDSHDKVRIVELCVGICITCAPATSKFLRHIFPRESSSETGFEWRWRKIHSSLSALRTHDHPKANKLEVASKANTGLYQKMNAKGDRRYGDCELALYSRNATTTVVVSQPSKEVSDGVIHLKVDLEQRQSHASL